MSGTKTNRSKVRGFRGVIYLRNKAKESVTPRSRKSPVFKNVREDVMKNIFDKSQFFW